MNNTTKITLEDQANELAYSAIQELGLYRELENHEWDALAEEYGKAILNELKDRIWSQIYRDWRAEIGGSVNVNQYRPRSN